MPRGRAASSCQIWSKSVKTRPRYGDFFIFSRWWPSAILDLLVCVRTTCERHLVVFIAVQNLVEIDAVVLIICMFFRFQEFGLKTPIHDPRLGIFWIIPPKWGEMPAEPKKGTSMRESASFEPSYANTRRRVSPVDKFPKKAGTDK